MRSNPATIPHVQSTLAKLSVCRTEAVGSKLYGCQDCGTRVRVHYSCGDRHCPQCRGATRANWVGSAEKWVVPGIDYYQVVFTIPDRLSSLTLGNRGEMFDLLFRSAWKSLKKVVEHEQQFEAAAAMVLHTWNQKLDAHVHVHAVVPGGGHSLVDRDTWKSAQPPPDKSYHDFWLADADVLRAEFRKRFLRGLTRLHKTGKLKLEGEYTHLRDADTFGSWLSPLEQVDWVTYIQPPPTESSDPANLVKYLARYLTGGPISDYRITDYDGHRVTFTARTGNVHGGSDQTERINLPVDEFVRRWCLHILPSGYTKSRRFGGLSNHHTKRYLAECRILLAQHAKPEPLAEDSNDAAVASTDPEPPPSEDSRPTCPTCPNCKSVMRLWLNPHRTSWRDVMSSSDRPAWYASKRGTRDG